MDLAEGHVSALSYVEKSSKTAEESGYGKLSIFNLGTGIGYSVLDMIEGMKVRRPDTYFCGSILFWWKVVVW